MAYFRQKQKNAVFILSLASADRSLDTGTLTADTDAYESGTVLIEVAGKFIRAAEATDAQAAASKRAAFLRDRTFAEADTKVLVIERDAEIEAKLTDLATLDPDVKASVVALTKAAGIVLR